MAFQRSSSTIRWKSWVQYPKRTSCRQSASMLPLRKGLFLLVFLLAEAPIFAQTPFTYRISISEPKHHWLQVEAIFPDLPRGPARVLMSRTSPGRYAVHE